MFIKREDYYAVCDRCEEIKQERDNLKGQLRIAENNELLLMKENDILRNVIRQVISLANSNTYSNADLRIRKIKELASTAINN